MVEELKIVYCITEPFAVRLSKFLTAAQKIINDWQHDFDPIKSYAYFPTLVMQDGKRYVKIVRKEGGNGGCSVHCFVDKTNGDILKAASYKAPAKGARGNIFDEDCGASAMTQWGCKYLK